jgi:hypothetical protein
VTGALWLGRDDILCEQPLDLFGRMSEQVFEHVFVRFSESWCRA